MYTDNVNAMARAAKTKVALLNKAPVSYVVSAIMAGAYIGVGIVLIFSLGAPLAESDSPFVRPVMAAAFGIALTLVVFAGAELFTGNNMIMTPMQMFIRGMLCNWLVCLALWSAGRTSNDGAKCVLLFWCLFAFIACGYEHSIANMTLLSMALFSPHGAAVSWLGFGRNMLFVTAGNIVGGAFFVGVMYWLATHKEKAVANV